MTQQKRKPGIPMPHPRVWFIVAGICLAVGIVVLALNPATPAPALVDGPQTYWPDVTNAFQHLEEGGPRRAGQMLLLFAGLFLIHACVCVLIRTKRITPSLSV